MPGIGGGGEGHGSPFRGVTGVLRSHTAHQEGSECLVPYVNQGKAGEVPYLKARRLKRGEAFGNKRSPLLRFVDKSGAMLFITMRYAGLVSQWRLTLYKLKL